jgi:hypothetical protein
VAPLIVNLSFKKPSFNIKKWNHIDFSFDPSKSVLYLVLVDEVVVEDYLFALQDIGPKPRWKINPDIDLQWSPFPHPWFLALIIQKEVKTMCCTTLKIYDWVMNFQDVWCISHVGSIFRVNLDKFVHNHILNVFHQGIACVLCILSISYCVDGF